jgi:trans-AT polyketide synthase, acyltransferase and oxidoreductase domains
MILTSARELPSVGLWRSGAVQPAFRADELSALLPQIREPLHVVREDPRGRIGVGLGGDVVFPAQRRASDYPLMATLPALYPEWMGNRLFCEVHHVRFPYVAGEMANGIATTRMVIAMAEAGMLGFFGAAGLAYERVEQAVDELQRALGDNAAWGVNLIHSPNEPALEDRVADLLIRRGVARISLSAFVELTPAVVRCAASGLRIDALSGRVERRRHLFAKISRPEVATRFMSPPPGEILRALVTKGLLTSGEAELAAGLPVAEDITVEADSGGHTDNQPLVALFPVIQALGDELTARHGYTRPIRVGAAGGLGTPAAVAGAFALGAAYVLTGSINQAAVESGLSQTGKAMLAEADLADVMMAPAADMFELGVRVQVLKRGSMFGVRAAKLYEAYRAYASLEAIPAELRTRLENEVLHATFDEIWADTQRFWQRRDPAEITRADNDPKHRLALVFRWYLGKASRWAIDGDAARRADYQIWCGPAMGSFNRWVKGSFLAAPANRTVVQIARNLLEGAAVLTRTHQARTYGVAVPGTLFQFRPRPLL